MIPIRGSLHAGPKPSRKPQRLRASAFVAAAAACAASIGSAADAWAQGYPPPGYPPPSYPPPGQPPSTGYPPHGPGYYPAPGYPTGYAPPPGYAAPAYAAGPLELDYNPAKPIPAGYHVESQTRRSLVVGGACAFAIPYALSIITASVAESGGGGDAWVPLYIPAAGPFVALGTLEPNATGTYLLVVDGIAQSAGLIMIVAGLAARREVLVRDASTAPRLSITPMTARGTVGLNVGGTL